VSFFHSLAVVTAEYTRQEMPEFSRLVQIRSIGGDLAHLLALLETILLD
jgi:hypothetical protein